jgi:hypothetical protein
MDISGMKQDPRGFGILNAKRVTKPCRWSRQAKQKSVCVRVLKHPGVEGAQNPTRGSLRGHAKCIWHTGIGIVVFAQDSKGWSKPTKRINLGTKPRRLDRENLKATGKWQRGGV